MASAKMRGTSWRGWRGWEGLEGLGGAGGVGGAGSTYNRSRNGPKIEVPFRMYKNEAASGHGLRR